MNKEAEWMNDRIDYIKGLKAPSEQQQLLVLLAEKSAPDASDKKKLNAIIRAEKATERAAKARAVASAMIHAEKQAAAVAARKARTHELCESAGLLGLAGLVDTETGKPTIDRRELLGALLGLAAVSADHPKREEWKKVGDDMLNFRTPTPAAVKHMADLRQKGGSVGYDEAGNYVRGLPGDKTEIIRQAGDDKKMMTDNQRQT